MSLKKRCRCGWLADGKKTLKASSRWVWSLQGDRTSYVGNDKRVWVTTSDTDHWREKNSVEGIPRTLESEIGLAGGDGMKPS